MKMVTEPNAQKPLTRLDIEQRLASNNALLVEVHEKQKLAQAMVLDPNASAEEGWLSTQALKQAEEGILHSMRILQHQLEQLTKTQIEEAQIQVAKPRQEKLDWLKTHPATCECGFVGKLVEGIRNPVIVGSGLGDEHARITLAYDCSNPNLTGGHHRFWLNLDSDVVLVDGELKPRTSTVKRKDSTNSRKEK
jgi:hypothetical protein